jgi:hypothetical protein
MESAAMVANSPPVILYASVSRPLTDEPVTIAVDEVDPTCQPGAPWVVRIYSDEAFHVRADGKPATRDDCPVLPEDGGILLSVSGGAKVSVVKKTGVTNATVWFTRMKRATNQ